MISSNDFGQDYQEPEGVGYDDFESEEVTVTVMVMTVDTVGTLELSSRSRIRLAPRKERN